MDWSKRRFPKSPQNMKPDDCEDCMGAGGHHTMPSCDGSGSSWRECRTCRGSGKLSTEDRLLAAAIAESKERRPMHEAAKLEVIEAAKKWRKFPYFVESVTILAKALDALAVEEQRPSPAAHAYLEFKRKREAEDEEAKEKQAGSGVADSQRP